MAYKPWRTHGGGLRIKPIFLKRSSFFHTEFAEIAVMFFCAIQLAY